MIILDVSVLTYHVTIECKDILSANKLKIMLSQNNYNFSFIYDHSTNSINIKYKLGCPPYNLKNKQEILLHEDTGNESDYFLKGSIYKQNEKIIVYNPYLDVFIEKNKNNYIIYGEEEKCLLCIVDLLREQIFQKYYEYQNYIFLKCAAFAYDDNNLCAIIGSHKSGKTTFLLNILAENKDFFYVTNSASYINKLNTDTVLYSWRPHLRIRNGTCKSIKTLKSFYDNKISLDDDVLKIKTYIEFNKIFPNPIKENGIIKKIIFIQPNDSTNINHLGNDYSINNKLLNNVKLIDNSHPNYLNLRIPNKNKLKRNLAEILSNMKKNIDFYQLNYNVLEPNNYSNILSEVGIL